MDKNGPRHGESVTFSREMAIACDQPPWVDVNPWGELWGSGLLSPKWVHRDPSNWTGLPFLFSLNTQQSFVSRVARKGTPPSHCHLCFLVVFFGFPHKSLTTPTHAGSINESRTDSEKEGSLTGGFPLFRGGPCFGSCLALRVGVFCWSE